MTIAMRGSSSFASKSCTNVKDADGNDIEGDEVKIVEVGTGSYHATVNNTAEKYRSWEGKARSLALELEEQDAQEVAESAELLGHNRVPRSQAEADEREKLERAKKTREVLESQRAREEMGILTLESLFEKEELGGSEKREVKITRKNFGGGIGSSIKRVLRLRNVTGPGTIFLTSDLSKLECTSTLHDRDDKPREVKVRGLIKLYLSNLHNCTVVTECKLITSVIEISHCINLKLVVKTQKVATIQCDLCDHLTLEFVGYDPQRDSLLFGDKEDKIYHAGVKDMAVVVRRQSDDGRRLEKKMDYIKDGAEAVGSATREEYQFVTHVVHGELVTERIVRIGDRALTEREMKEEEKKRRHKEKTSVCPDTKEDISTVTASREGSDSLTASQIDDIFTTCEKEKARGNEAFQEGEYAQAVLHYSMAIDKGSDVKNADGKDLFDAIHVCYANRSACFLKMGHHEKALEDAVTCTNLNSTYIKGLFRRGLALHALQRYEEALPWLVKAQKLEPKNKQVKQAIQFCEIKLQIEMNKRMGRT